MLDPVTLGLAFNAAKLALSGIQTCCDVLSEGKVEIQRIKKGVADAQEIAKEIGGFGSWLKRLFGSPKPVETSIADTAKPPPQKAKDEYVDHIPDEDEISEQFFDHLISFMNAQSAILDHIAETREQLLNAYNPKQNNRIAAAQLIKDERKINQMALELHSMLSNAPKVLGAVYSDFKEKYPVVVQAQNKAKERERLLKAQASARRQQQINDKIDLGVALFITTIFLAELWAIWISLFIAGW